MDFSKESSKDYAHFVLTVFNVKYDPPSEERLQEAWLKHRFKLFSQFTYPSLRAQTCQNFKWIVLFDENTPKAFAKRIESYAEWKNFIPVYQDKYAIPTEAILNNLSGNPKYLITSRIDNDDAFSKDYVRMTQDIFANQGFLFLNYSKGYVLGKSGIYLDEQLSNPFVSLIEKIEGFKTVIFPESHTKISNYGPVKQISARPAWLQVVHERNLINKIRGELQPPATLMHLPQEFTIRRNLIPLFLANSFHYSMRQILNATWAVRHPLKCFFGGDK